MTKLALLSINKKKALIKLHQKKYRYKSHLFLCEGFNLFQEATGSEQKVIDEIIITKKIEGSAKGSYILSAAKSGNIPVYLCSEQDMNNLCEEKTPQGIVFTSPIRLPEREILNHCEEDTIIYLEKISDPGNLGTIIRSMNWFNKKTVILGPECVDPFNGKTVRSSAGAIFDIQVFCDMPFREVFNTFKKKNYNFIATTPKGGISLDKWNVKGKNIIFFGPEIAGLSEEILNKADLKIMIQKKGAIESLNLSVAAGIILYKITSN